MVDEAHSKPGKLNPYEKVPQEFKDVFKSWKGRSGRISPARSEELEDITRTRLNGHDISTDTLCEAFQGLQHEYTLNFPEIQTTGNAAVYYSSKVPGLHILPSLLPPAIQQTLLSKLLHRDLSNPNHATNLHLHYDVQYPEGPSLEAQSSFFSSPQNETAFSPKKPNEHKPLTTNEALKKKLRWITLGGQYDWTAKAYPDGPPPQFPQDIAALIRTLFPDMEPQAAIVNLYSPGDTLSMHRDVSEEVIEGLVSISIGCDAIFVIGLYDKDSSPEVQYEVLRLRSGDAVYMTGKSRLAWHGVPSIIPDTCPDYLEAWPGKEFPSWTGWMKDKRINLNVRQMYKSG